MKNSSKNKRLDRVPKQYKHDVFSDLAIIADKLKKRRKAKGYTQEELAEILNIEPSTLQGIEQMRNRPSLELLLAMVKVLEIKITLK